MNRDTRTDSDLLSRAEAAERLRIGQRSLDSLLARGALATVRIGRRRLIDADDLARFIAASREGARP